MDISAGSSLRILPCRPKNKLAFRRGRIIVYGVELNRIRGRFVRAWLGLREADRVRIALASLAAQRVANGVHTAGAWRHCLRGSICARGRRSDHLGAGRSFGRLRTTLQIILHARFTIGRSSSLPMVMRGGTSPSSLHFPARTSAPPAAATRFCSCGRTVTTSPSIRIQIASSRWHIGGKRVTWPRSAPSIGSNCRNCRGPGAWCSTCSMATPRPPTSATAVLSSRYFSKASRLWFQPRWPNAQVWGWESPARLSKRPRKGRHANHLTCSWTRLIPIRRGATRSGTVARTATCAWLLPPGWKGPGLSMVIWGMARARLSPAIRKTPMC